MFKVSSYRGGIAQTNGYLVTRDDGRSLLIDAPEGIADWLAGLGVRIEALLLTHLHYDHVADAAAVRQAHACPVLAWEAECTPGLTLVSILHAMGMLVHVEPFEIDRSLQGEPAVEAAGLQFAILHIPGHSPDSVCFRPEQRDEEGRRVLFGGDVLFNGSVGRTDFPGGSLDLLASGIREKLYTLPDDTLVYPGHGPVTTIGEEKAGNPWVASLERPASNVQRPPSK